MKLTKAQREAIDDAATPRQAYGFGGGRIDANPIVVRSLVRLGLAHETRLTFRNAAHLTSAGWKEAGKEPCRFAVLETSTASGTAKP